MKKWLFNPFFYIAGLQSLIAGAVIMLLTAFISYHSHTHFDGVIDIHVGKVSPLSVYFWEQFIDWGCAVLLFYPAGLIFSTSKIRFIDIAGTMALARWPMLICSLLGFGIVSPRKIPDIMNNADILLGIIMYALFIILPFTIWMVALMYNAYRISLNMKGGKAIGIFIVALLFAEIISSFIAHQLYKHII